ncbi:BBP7 family outer membrane beta-barrel protein [Rubripirellula obstinata]|nr:BBP7 family outer membrane beta-barrel protein [Rubripirellula obstinata]
MNQIKAVLLFSAMLASIGGIAIPSASVQAQPPRTQNADLDFAASGYLMPPGANPANAVRQAGMVGQMAGGPTQYAPAGYAQPMPSNAAPTGPAGVAQVGFFSGGSAGNSGGCDSGGCDSGCCGGGGGGCDSMGYGQMGHGQMGGGYGGPLGMGMMPGICNSGGCGSGCGGGGAYQQCDPILTGGIVGKMRGEGGADGEMSGLRHLCMFCRGGGCSACQSFHPSALLGALAALRPYSEAGLCAQRWYDLSAEAVFLGHNAGGNGALTSQGISGPIVLNANDAGANDLEAGIRLSGAIIMGPGGNLELTYMGGQEWSGSQSVSDPNAELFSFISDFGIEPGTTLAGEEGFDDTDRSLSQSIAGSSRFHSGELNYRRRTVGPYCRFQGSWLAGLRYLRFDNGQLLTIRGQDNNTAANNGTRFFTADAGTENNFFGAQIGGDLWWNLIPGVSIGTGIKGAWGQNDYSSRTLVRSNSAGPGATPGEFAFENSDRDTTVVGEFELKSMYRLNRDWTFRSAYYLIAMDDFAQAGLDVGSLRSLANSDTPAGIDSTGTQFSSLVVQGFSFGAEYTW